MADERMNAVDLFDINGDGMVDPGEEYLAFRIWEEMNGIDEEKDESGDGESFGEE